MARYNTLDDGSSLFELDGGRQVRTALDPERLAKLGAEFDPSLALDKRATDITTRLDDVRAKYDPAYATARDERKKKSDDAAGRLEIDQKAGELKNQLDEQRATDIGGATAQNDGAPAPTALESLGKFNEVPRNVVDVANQSAPAPAQVRFTPNTAGAPAAPSMGSYAASQQAEQGADPVRNAIADIALRNAFKRNGPTKGGWVPTSRSVARDEVPPPEYLSQVDEAERGEEAVAQANSETAAQRFNETIVTPQLDQLEQNISSLDAAYQRRKAYDSKLAEAQKFADDQEKAVSEMKTVNPRDDYFDNNGGIFGRLLAGVAAGAGQWASMAKGGGGPNNAMNIINDAIKDHGQMLRDKYDNAKDSAKMARNAYGQMLAQYGDPETAMEALNLKGEVMADRLIKVQMGRHLNAQETAGLDQWLAQRKVARAARWADAAGKSAGRTVANEGYAQPTGGGTSIDKGMLELALKARGEQGKNPEAWRQDAEAISRAVRLSPEDAQRLGTPVLFGTDKEEKAKAQAAIQASTKAMTSIRRMKEISKTSGWEVNPDLRTEMKAHQGKLQALIANPLGLRQQTKEELESISGPLVSANAWKLDSQVKKSLDVAETIFGEEKNEWMRTLLKDPYKPNFAEGDVETKPVR